MRRIIAVVGAATAALCVAASPGLAATPSPAGTPAGPGVERSSTGSYIVVMAADPLVRSTKVKDLGTPSARKRKVAIRATHDAVLKHAGVSTDRKTTDFATAVNGFAVRTDLRGAEKIARAPGVAVVLPDELRQPTALSSGDLGRGRDPKAGTNGLNTFLGLTGKGDAYAKGITGKGVLVGVIDTGIWPEHPSFAPNAKLPQRRRSTPRRGRRAPSATPRGTPTTSRSAATTSWSARASSWIPTRPKPSCNPPSSTPPATTRATARTRPPPPPVTPTSAPASPV